MMGAWQVTFWNGERVVRFASEQRAWESVPEGDGVTTGVMFVDVWHASGQYRHRLTGHDYYWLAGDTFGVFNDPSNWHWYGGTPANQYHAWRWVQDGSELVAPATALPTAHVLNGVMVPDEVAWEHGLMPVGERLPPRPR